MTREEYLIFQGQEREIEKLKQELQLKDSIIKKYEEAIQDVGAKLTIFEDDNCIESVMYDRLNDKPAVVIYHTIEFPKYQFAYKREVRNIKEKLNIER